MKAKCLYCYKNVVDGNDFHNECSLAFFDTPIAPKIEYSLHQMSELARNVVERSIAVPGVQAKLSMSLVKELALENETRLTVVGALGGQYIFKPPSDRFLEMPENEHISMRIAESFGIPTVSSSLIRLKSGELSYITKRIDRTSDGQKIHMIDMFQITEAFDKYKSSMERIGKSIHKYSDNTLLDKIFFFELTLFSFLTGNSDMHLKNFSMIQSSYGWVLSPAYDLLNVAIANPEDTEELALTLGGKKRKLQRKHFEQFAIDMGLNQKQIKSAFGRMVKNKNKAEELIQRSFLSENMKASYLEILNNRYKQIGLI